MTAPVPAARAARPAHRAGGQALVEFMASMLVLAPLFMLLPLLGRYLDIAFAAQVAARFAAFGVTRNNINETPAGAQAAWMPADVLQREVANRFFGRPGAPILATDLSTPDNGPAADPLWVKPNGEPLIPDRASAVLLGYGKADSADPAAGADSASDTRPFAELQPWMPRCVYGLDASGIYTVNLAVNLSNLPSSPLLHPFDTLDLALHRHTSVLYGSWSALDDTQVGARVLRNPIVYPASALEAEFDAASFALLAVDPLSFDSTPSGFQQLRDVARGNVRGLVFYPVPTDDASAPQQSPGSRRSSHLCGTLALPSW